MLHKIIPLREDDARVTLTTYVADYTGICRDALLVIPGGGYGCVCSDREGEPIALAFLARGYNCFVLHYSVGADAKFPRPLADASLAMQYIREHAEEFGINADRVFAVGFSAGGHLCASLGTFWNSAELRAALPEMKEGVNRPTGTILSYAVLSASIPTHYGSFYNILGTKSPTEEELRRYSVELSVGEQTSPAFIWHTEDDPVVPVGNAFVMMQALAAHKIPFASHIFPHGPHGLALANKLTAQGNPAQINPEAEKWVEEADAWMQTVPSL